MSLRTAGYGTVRPVVWEDGGGDPASYPIHLLPLLQARQLKPFVLLNDVRHAAIDAASLERMVDELAVIDGGCICCDSIYDLVNQLLKVRSVPGRVVLIEANGTTDPLFGDRCNELTVIGQSPDLALFVDELAACFCTAEEVRQWQRGATFSDPWPHTVIPQ